jgi:two-component system sensor histidine kinase ChiS
LDGVRVVNEGNLDVVVPVYVYDEIGYLSTSFNRMVKSVSESETELVEALEFQAKLTSSYSYFVPKQLLKLLDRHSIIDIKLGDNIEKKMTILFSDIRSFTSLSEKMTPEQNFYFINNFLKRVGPIVRKHEGYIDKYIGDGIMALFPDSPINAVKASIEMQWVGREYNRQRCMEGQEPIRFGVGVHTGIVMLGTIGEEKRMEGTVISDAVNLASRLEGLTKIYDSSIIVSYNTLAYIKQYGSFRYRFLDRAQVKGKKSWVDIYEILDSYPEDQIEIKLKTKKLFEEATALYFQKRLPEAMGQFKKILAIDPTDKAAQLYINRCQHFIQFGVSPDSNGITPVDEKY